MGSSKVDEVSPSIMPTSSMLSRDPAFIEFARQMLDSSELADGLAPEQMARIAAIGEIRSFEEGQLICDEHEHGDELYIIEAGSVEVWLDPSSISRRCSRRSTPSGAAEAASLRTDPPVCPGGCRAVLGRTIDALSARRTAFQTFRRECDETPPWHAPCGHLPVGRTGCYDA